MKEQACVAAGDNQKKMVRTPCCEKMGLKKGPWTPEEDQILVSFVQRFGHGNWRALPKQAGRTDNEIKNYWHTRLKKRPNNLATVQATQQQQHCSNQTLVLQRDMMIINHATMLPNIPANFTTGHHRIQIPGDNVQSVSRQEQFCLELPDSMETITTGHAFVEGNTTVTDVSPGRDIAVMEAAMKRENNNSNDMEFWHNVFMKAGDSIDEDIMDR
ncbi:hypothetical protein JRO89_XS04G0154800 [Xanthoceras sorbifolium]|uniref:Uncharacterized protein n=1 Tax=Xanthoceras sorbifolium TaxID=99658 RepID=A0ABQ8I5F8_9ROSI|nr:hypothetical protein JRO89_XS04G0154800 [Xanthoceras sorbifolium]